MKDRCIAILEDLGRRVGVGGEDGIRVCYACVTVSRAGHMAQIQACQGSLILSVEQDRVTLNIHLSFFTAADWGKGAIQGIRGIQCTVFNTVTVYVKMISSKVGGM